MKGFIEVTNQGMKILINIRHIFKVLPEGSGCEIQYAVSVKETHVEESYDDVKSLILHND